MAMLSEKRGKAWSHDHAIPSFRSVVRLLARNHVLERVDGILACRRVAPLRQMSKLIDVRQLFRPTQLCRRRRQLRIVKRPDTDAYLAVRFKAQRRAADIAKSTLHGLRTLEIFWRRAGPGESLNVNIGTEEPARRFLAHAAMANTGRTKPFRPEPHRSTLATTSVSHLPLITGCRGAPSHSG